MNKKMFLSLLSITLLLMGLIFTPMFVLADTTPSIVSKGSGNDYHALLANGLPLLIEEGSQPHLSSVSYDSNGDGVYDTVFATDIDLRNYDVFGGSDKANCNQTSIKMAGGEVHYILGGSLNSGDVNGDVNIEITGGYVMDISLGNYTQANATAEVKGKAKIEVSGGEISDLYGGGWAWGSGSFSELKDVLVDIKGGQIKSIYAGWGGNSGSGNITDSFIVNISGGTILENVSASPLVDSAATKKIEISGGTIRGAVNDVTPTLNATPIYKTSLTFIDGNIAAKDKAVDKLVTEPDLNYGMADLKTDANGKISVFLPADTITKAGFINSIRFESATEIKTLPDNTAVGDLINIPKLYAGMIHRPITNEATVKFRSDRNGTYYYQIADTDAAPTSEDLASWTAKESIEAEQSIALEIDNLNSGPQYVHVVLKDNYGIISEPITFFMPTDYYYYENFESYPEGSTNFSNGDLLLPFKFIHGGSGWTNQKIIENSGSNDSRFLTMSSSSNTTSDVAMPLETGLAESGNVYAIEYLTQPMGQNNRNGELRLHTGPNFHGNLKDALDVEFSGGNIRASIVNGGTNSQEQILLNNYTSEQWYHMKILVDTNNKLYSVYVDGELKASDLEAIGDYTFLNLTSGFSSTVRFDNFEIYVTEAPPPKPQLYSANTSTDGQTIALTFDLDMASDPSANGFNLEVDGITHTINSAGLDTDKKIIILNLDSAIEYGQVAKISYTPGNIKSQDGGSLLAFSNENITNNVPEKTYSLTIPNPITENGITVSISLDPIGPVVIGTEIKLTSSPKGTAIIGGIHTIGIFKDLSGFTETNKNLELVAGEVLNSSFEYEFKMPAADITDFGFYHTFQAFDFPVLTSAETKTDGTQIILTFDVDMTDPASSKNNFTVEAGGEIYSIASAVLDADSKTILLNLDAALAYGQNIKISYTPGILSSALGGTLQSFTDELVNNTVVETTYNISITALSGGQITANLGTATAGTKIELTITPDSGKRLKSGSLIYNDGNDNQISGTDFIMPAADVTISAQFENIPYEPPVYEPEPPVDEPEPPVEPPLPLYHAGLIVEEQEEIPIPVILDEENTQAYVELTTENFDDEEITITMPEIPEITAFAVGIPVEKLSTEQRKSSVTVRTSVAEVTLPSNMLTGLNVTGELANLKIEAGDKTKLSEEQQSLVGSRPLLQFSLSIDQAPTEYSNPLTQITISLAYTPTEEEMESPESVIIYYLDNQGEMQIIPNGYYNPETGFVTFKTSHFSNYAVAFNRVSFNDLPSSPWFTKAIDFLAARQITVGTGQGRYSPEKELTRGEFILLLLNSYNIAPILDYENNFDDAGNTWYTAYLAAAKELALSQGVGHNLYAPNRNITRLEVIALLFNTLKATNQLPTVLTDNIPPSILDKINVNQMAEEIIAALIANGQIEGFDINQFDHQATVTRGEIALLLHHLLTN